MILFFRFLIVAFLLVAFLFLLFYVDALLTFVEVQVFFVHRGLLCPV